MESALAQIQRDLPECVGVAYIDTSMALLIAVRTVDSHPIDVLDMVAVGTAQLLGDVRFRDLDRAFAKDAQDDSEVRSVVALSPSITHVFLRGERFPSHVLVLVCRSTANLGMVIKKGREALVRTENAI